MKTLSLFLLVCTLSAFPAATPKKYLREIEDYRAEKEAEFKDPKHSPLREKAVDFEGNTYYEADINFRVKARVERIEEGDAFLMPTSNPDRQKTYVPYAKLHFEIQGRELNLTAYFSPDVAKMAGYENHLFLPFTDLTNGSETYGGGRYIDLTKPKGKKLWLDFNKCYNPYCAYSDGWSCPIPPQENFLDLHIEAGVKDYKH